MLYIATVIQNFNTLSATVTNLSRLKFTKFSVSCFFKKLNMMRNHYERLEEVFEVNMQLFMQSRICTTNVNIDRIVLILCIHMK